MGVQIEKLTSNPKINGAVCWGHPSGHIEAEFSSEALAVSDEVLADLYSQLPRLFESLGEAIAKGKPSNWDESHEYQALAALVSIDLMKVLTLLVVLTAS